jgi:hypothetical protein
MARTGTARRNKSYTVCICGGDPRILIDRQSAKDVSIANRMIALETEIQETGGTLARLDEAIVDGAIEPDVRLRDHIDAVVSLMNGTIEMADIQTRKSYLRGLIQQIRVEAGEIQIIGDKANLAAVIVGQQTAAGKISGFVRQWHTSENADDKPCVIEMMT